MVNWEFSLCTDIFFCLLNIWATVSNDWPVIFNMDHENEIVCQNDDFQYYLYFDIP